MISIGQNFNCEGTSLVSVTANEIATDKEPLDISRRRPETEAVERYTRKKPKL